MTVHTPDVVDSGLLTCQAKGCGRPVREVTLASGKTLLIDPAPHQHGSVIADGAGGYRVLDGSQLPAERAAWRPHAQTCLALLKNRRRAWNASPVVPRDLGPDCPVCGEPTDGELARAGITTHPTC